MNDPALKQLWVDALRSGEYKQGTAYLYNVADNSYCCLGVLCKLICPDEDQWEELGLADGNEMLSMEMFESIQLHPGAAKFLACCNDGSVEQRWGFEKIADYIEKHAKV